MSFIAKFLLNLLYCADVPLRILKFCLFRKFLRILKSSVTKCHSMHVIHTMNTRQQQRRSQEFDLGGYKC